MVSIVSECLGGMEVMLKKERRRPERNWEGEEVSQNSYLRKSTVPGHTN